MNDLHIAQSAIQMASWERRRREWGAERPRSPRRFWLRLGIIALLALLLAAYVALTIARPW
jgi:nitrogen fixation/metabolism regulation signal transduction histidine kinase